MDSGCLVHVPIWYSISLFAQDEAPAEGAQKTAGFMTIVFGGDIVSIAIWMMLFGASAATLAFIIDAMISIKRDKLIPEDLVEGVRESLNEGDLNSAIAACERKPFSTIKHSYGWFLKHH